MKKTLSAFVILAMLVTLTACGGAAETGGGGGGSDQLVIGFAQIGSESDWRVGSTNSIIAAVENAGHELIFVDGHQMQENQIAALRDFITRGVDYIGFSPVVETGWDEVMREIRDAGIPVIMLDRNIEMPNRYDYYETWIGANFVEEGQRAAEWLIDYLEHADRAGEDINIVELQGTVGSSPAMDRQRGFAEVIADHPNLNISQTETGDFTTELGKTVMETFLARAAAEGTPIDVLFAHNDGMAIGAIEAIREAGLNPGEDIIIIGVDAVLLAFEAIIRGEMNVTVECSPLLGPQFVEAIEALERGESIPQVTFSLYNVYDETLHEVFPDRYRSASEHVHERVY